MSPQKSPGDISVHESACIDPPWEIGEGTRIWHFSHVLAESVIGRNCSIGQNVIIGPEVKVGDGWKIQNNVSVYRGVTLEEDVFVGPSAVFTNVNTPRAAIEPKSEFQPTLVRHGATIGANATIVCGVTLGAHCFVAAGAVVTKEVPPHALAAGQSARIAGWVGHVGEPLEQHPNIAKLICPRTGRRYRLDGEQNLVEIDNAT